MISNLSQLPNILTILRILLVFPFVYYMTMEDFGLALGLLFVAGFTDSLDGLLARRFGWRSQFGSIADPVADKILLVTVYMTLGVGGHLPIWLVGLIVVRDLYIFCGAIAYWFLVGRYEGKPTLVSKACTFMLISLGLLTIANLVWPVIPLLALEVIIWVVVSLCLISVLQYSVIGVRGYLAQGVSAAHPSVTPYGTEKQKGAHDD